MTKPNRSFRFSFTRLLVLASVAAVAASCDHPTAYVHSTPAGSYTLSTVDGARLPVMLSTGDSLLSSDLGLFELNSTYTETRMYRRGAGSPTTGQTDGTFYTPQTAAVRLVSSSGIEFAVGTYDNSSLTLVVSGHTYMYLRE